MERIDEIKAIKINDGITIELWSKGVSQKQTWYATKKKARAAVRKIVPLEPSDWPILIERETLDTIEA